MKSGDLVVSRHAYPDARSIVRKGCVLAFFLWLQATQISPLFLTAAKISIIP